MVINPLQTATMVQCAVEGDHAVKQAYKAKLRKFQALCTSKGLVFFPLAVDTFRGWHKDSLTVITRLGVQEGRNLDKEPGEQCRFLRQRIGISLAKDCSQMLSSRNPTHVPAHIDGSQDFN